MSLEPLSSLLESVAPYRSLRTSLTKKGARARSLVLKEAVPFVMAALWQELRLPALFLAPRPEEARRLYEQLLLWCGQDAPVFHFPETETLPFERLVSDTATVHQRVRSLAALLDASQGALTTPLVVASVAAVSQKTIDAATFAVSCHTLERNQRIELEPLLARWHRMGYQFERAVEIPGTVSRRGGILDIFPVDSPSPVRIELWGDQIESIRRFDPTTQRSIGPVEAFTVMPAQEILPALTDPSIIEGLIGQMNASNCTTATRERIKEELSLLANGQQIEDLNFYSGFFSRGSLLDHFPPEGLLVMYQPSELAEAAWETDQRTLHLRETKEGRGDLPRGFPSSHLLWREIEEGLSRVRRHLEVLQWGADEVDKTLSALPFGAAPSFWGRLDQFAHESGRMARDGQRVVVVTHHAKRLGEILAEDGVGAALPQALEATPAPASVTVLQSTRGGLDQGFTLPLDGGSLVLLSDAEIFGVSKQRRHVRRTHVRREAFLSELNPGDLVVHIEHGIARFAATTHMTLEEGEREYLILEYAEGDKLYVPIEHLDRVAPYVAPMEHPPSLTRLGTQEWSRIKERVKRSTREMASELLSLYASREVVEGLAYPPDPPWQKELEDSFPYEETPDQLATIAEVKADMEKPKPMDRLVCGDVGYGKTEVGLRAAFKAVMEGMQVAVLVPTTVLAQQHYVTFSERLSPFPVKVEVLSRFRTDREQREVVEGLATGTVDICIGTHRLIQKDVSFKSLGLVIVDEEQRFGVAHKERLKQMRKEVDVLTLSATPIPRTLHMALSGVRDMSTMETPPEERLPIKTYVSEYSDELIREAILRELDREGQVFFLHNRVHNIDYMADLLHIIVPEAKFAVAHGQMPEEQLEQVMLDFSQGKIDVLVCSTIIESGLDMPNVNTLIINRADMFGLAQLYQLRGRVGRGSHRAYSYLLVPKSKRLTEAAEKRLKTILAATELGAGFRIAMKDLEIRGSGNLLGAEQSGHIHAVGFDLYTRLLAEAVEDITVGSTAERAEGGGETPGGDSSLPDAKISLGISAHLPEEYVSDLAVRLGVYHRMMRFAQLEEIEAMAEELRDRFGPLPLEVHNLLYVARMKLLAHQAGVESITREDSQIVLRLMNETGGARGALQKALGDGLRIGNTQIRLERASSRDRWQVRLKQTLERLAAFRERVLTPAGGG